jgi:hypothetical protein
MSFSDLLVHDLLIAHADPAASPDATGQLFIDSTGQPIGDATVDPTDPGADWLGAMSAKGRVVEMSARWPQGPGAGPELVDTRILFPAGTAIHELDKVLWEQTGQAYQAVFVREATGIAGVHHVKVQARRIPL